MGQIARRRGAGTRAVAKGRAPPRVVGCGKRTRGARDLGCNRARGCVCRCNGTRRRGRRRRGIAEGEGLFAVEQGEGFVAALHNHNATARQAKLGVPGVDLE